MYTRDDRQMSTSRSLAAGHIVRVFLCRAASRRLAEDVLLRVGALGRRCVQILDRGIEILTVSADVTNRRTRCWA